LNDSGTYGFQEHWFYWSFFGSWITGGLAGWSFRILVDFSWIVGSGFRLDIGVLVNQSNLTITNILLK
jgi:hypothetical protein